MIAAPNRGSGRFRRSTDAVDSWARVGVIVTAIVLDGICAEALILGAEFMMLLRWTRDVLRYDVRWIVQEKMRLLGRRRPRS
jgi:hypothetical protein